MFIEPTQRMLEITREMEALRPILGELSLLDGDEYLTRDAYYAACTKPLQEEWTAEWRRAALTRYPFAALGSAPLIPRPGPG